MKTNDELKELCESSQILNVELTDEEVFSVNCDLMSVQDSIKFIKKYGSVLVTRSKTNIDEIMKDWDV